MTRHVVRVGGAAPAGRGRLAGTVAAVGALAWAACAEATPPSTEAGSPPGDEAPPPAAAPAPRSPGIGFLDQGDVTVRMAGQGLIVDILPMNAEVLELATDDLRTYLEDALKKVPDTVAPELRREGTPFLIGFSATEKEIPFEPSQVYVESEGRRFFPRTIVPVSARFGDRTLQIFQAPVWAVYVYDPGIDLVSTLEFGYRDELSTRGAWRSVVQNVEEARARARATR